MSPAKRFEEARVGWMENCQLQVQQLSCDGCQMIFYYVNDVDDTLKPRFCPECGRRFSNAERD